MNSKSQQALNVLTKWATEATLNMENKEVAKFFYELADWAYAQYEACLIDAEPEMQNYEEE